jgi:hypothetical protein
VTYHPRKRGTDSRSLSRQALNIGTALPVQAQVVDEPLEHVGVVARQRQVDQDGPVAIARGADSPDELNKFLRSRESTEKARDIQCGRAPLRSREHMRVHST